MTPLHAPFPYFGGKGGVASRVWDALGDVDAYLEPFFGSGAVLLSRPEVRGREIVNDLDGLLCNFWRAVIQDPDAVVDACYFQVNETEMHARHLHLLSQKDDLTQRLMADPEYYDAKLAGYWVYGMSCWVGSGWCSGNGPWGLNDKGELIKKHKPGINRKIPRVTDNVGVFSVRAKNIRDYLSLLQQRLFRVKVLCGDWKRSVTSGVQHKSKSIGVFLDPPYGESRGTGLYTHDSLSLYQEVTRWCLDNPHLRIVLAGYEGEHNTLEEQGWRKEAWVARGGYGNQSKTKENTNRRQERLWFSPACIQLNACSSL